MPEKRKKADPRKFESKLDQTVILAAEAMVKAKCVTSYDSYRPDESAHPGGMCSCCGAGPRIDAEDDWWLVFKAGFCDSDGVFMSMLCAGPDGSGCLEDIRADSDRREPSFRDEAAALIADLLGDDLDGAQAMFEDADSLGMLDIPGED